MSEESRPEGTTGDRAATGILGYARRHPVITATLVVCTLVGAGLGFALLSGEWSSARRIAAGAAAGGGVGLLRTATKMFD
jgi:hypothetical protein